MTEKDWIVRRRQQICSICGDQKHKCASLDVNRGTGRDGVFNHFPHTCPFMFQFFVVCVALHESVGTSQQAHVHRGLRLFNVAVRLDVA